MPRVRRRPRNLRQQRAAPEDRGSRARLHELLGMPPPPYDIRDEEYPYPVLEAYRKAIGWNEPTYMVPARTLRTPPATPSMEDTE